jgi:hypothetical protein
MTEADWATDLANTICADVMGRRGTVKQTVDLIAARLRVLRNEGVGEGLAQAREAVALQKEYQRDVEEYGMDGWSGEQ